MNLKIDRVKLSTQLPYGSELDTYDGPHFRLVFFTSVLKIDPSKRCVLVDLYKADQTSESVYVHNEKHVMQVVNDSFEYVPKYHEVPVLIVELCAVVPSLFQTPVLQKQGEFRHDLRKLTKDQSSHNLTLTSTFVDDDHVPFTLELTYSVSGKYPSYDTSAELSSNKMFQMTDKEIIKRMDFPPQIKQQIDTDKKSSYLHPQLHSLFTDNYRYDEDGIMLPDYIFCLTSPHNREQYSVEYLKAAGKFALNVQYGVRSDEETEQLWQAFGHEDNELLRKYFPLSEFTQRLLNLLVTLVQTFTMTCSYVDDVERVDKKTNAKEKTLPFSFKNDSCKYLDEENMENMGVNESGDCEEGSDMNAKAWTCVSKLANTGDDTLTVLAKLAGLYVPFVCACEFTGDWKCSHMNNVFINKKQLILPTGETATINSSSLPVAVFIDSITFMRPIYHIDCIQKIDSTNEVRRAWTQRLFSVFDDALDITVGDKRSEQWRVVWFEEPQRKTESCANDSVAILRMMTTTPDYKFHTLFPITNKHGETKIGCMLRDIDAVRDIKTTSVELVQKEYEDTQRSDLQLLRYKSPIIPVSISAPSFKYIEMAKEVFTESAGTHQTYNVLIHNLFKEEKLKTEIVKACSSLRQIATEHSHTIYKLTLWKVVTNKPEHNRYLLQLEFA